VPVEETVAVATVTESIVVEVEVEVAVVGGCVSIGESHA
jgi:hypothetical protein